MKTDARKPFGIAELADKLLSEERVALFCHVHPDGDTLGSACALKIALTKVGVKAEVFCSDSVPLKYTFLPEIRNVKSELDGKFSAFVAIDNAEITRLGAFAAEFSEFKNTFNIDHHVSNTRYAAINYVVDGSSNSENVYDIINAMKVGIDGEIANLLALGIVTDSGNFHHKNVTKRTFLCAAELLERGADFNEIYFNAFSRQSPERVKLFSRVMDKIRYFEDGKIALITVSLSDLKETGAKQDETEGFIDFVMGIVGVEVGICLMQTDNNSYKASFRSKNTDVNAVASVFGGGGHKLASGCKISGSYEEAVDKAVSTVRRFLD